MVAKILQNAVAVATSVCLCVHCDIRTHHGCNRSNLDIHWHFDSTNKIIIESSALLGKKGKFHS